MYITLTLTLNKTLTKMLPVGVIRTPGTILGTSLFYFIYPRSEYRVELVHVTIGSQMMVSF